MWGERLDRLRTEGTLSKKELAYVLGRSEQCVGAWVRGDGEPGPVSRRAIERLELVLPDARAVGKTSPEELRALVEHPEMPVIVPLTPAPRPASRRAELAVYRLGDAETPGARPVSLWLGVAAGTPRTPEAKDEPLLVQHAPGDCMAVRVTGDSMVDTLRDGDIVVVRPVCGRGLRLPPGRETPLAQVKAVVPDGAIALIELDGEPPTIKRVKYQAHGRRWYLMLCADNGDAAPGYPRVVDRHDDCRIVGLVIGRAEK